MHKAASYPGRGFNGLVTLKCVFTAHGSSIEIEQRCSVGVLQVGAALRALKYFQQ